MTEARLCSGYSSATPKFRILLVTGFKFLLVMDLLYPKQDANPLFQFVDHMRCAGVGNKHCQDTA